MQAKTIRGNLPTQNDAPYISPAVILIITAISFPNLHLITYNLSQRAAPFYNTLAISPTWYFFTTLTTNKP
jgi:hypothetical protein